MLPYSQVKPWSLKVVKKLSHYYLNDKIIWITLSGPLQGCLETQPDVWQPHSLSRLTCWIPPQYPPSRQRCLPTLLFWTSGMSGLTQEEQQWSRCSLLWLVSSLLSGSLGVAPTKTFHSIFSITFKLCYIQIRKYWTFYLKFSKHSSQESFVIISKRGDGRCRINISCFCAI